MYRLSVPPLWVVVSMIWLAGCMSNPRPTPTSSNAAPKPSVNWNDPSFVSGQVKMDRDNYQKVTHYLGPNSSDMPWAEVEALRAFKRDNGPIGYQVYLRHRYVGEWRFYDVAFDSNGVQLELVKISQKVLSCSGGRCSHEEDVALNVSREYLERASKDGINVQLSGRNGAQVFTIPHGYVEGFLRTAN